MTTLDEKGLAPCPFCGSPAELEHDSDHHGEWFNLGCSQHWGKVDPDEACPAGRLWYTELPKKEAEAIAAWNRRAPDAEMLEVLEDIHDALDDALGDSDITHIEDEEDLRNQEPVQWAAMKLADIIARAEAAGGEG